MSLTNPNSLLLRPSPILSTPKLSPYSLRCQAADIPVAGPSIPRWSQFPAPIEPTTNDSDWRNAQANAKDRRWSRDKESYLKDDDDALPLPMTYPNSSPVSSDVIDKCMRCDPQVEDCKEVVYEWTGKCRSCQGSGYISYYPKRGKKDITCKCIPCFGIERKTRELFSSSSPPPSKQWSPSLLAKQGSYKGDGPVKCCPRCDGT